MLRIGAVYEKDGVTLKDSHLKLIGRAGEIYNHDLDVGQCLILEYKNKRLRGSCLRTSPIEEFDEDDGGVWVTTRNTVYRFDNIRNHEVDDTIGCFDKVVYAKFLGKNGRDYDLKTAFKDGLIPNNKYVVDNVMVGGWHTDVYLDVQVNPYNSAMFEFTDEDGTEFDIYSK